MNLLIDKAKLNVNQMILLRVNREIHTQGFP